MPPEPKRKTSKGRRNRRRSHHALSLPPLVECPQCHELRLAHHVCPSCGTYRHVEYLELEE